MPKLACICARYAERLLASAGGIIQAIETEVLVFTVIRIIAERVGHLDRVQGTRPQFEFSIGAGALGVGNPFS